MTYRLEKEIDGRKFTLTWREGEDKIEFINSTGEIVELDRKRASFLMTALTVATGKKTKNSTPLPPNAGQPWTPELDEQLRIEHGSGKSVADLVKSFARTRGSIKSRLNKLGLHDATTGESSH